MATTAALNRINDQFARYAWHFLPLHVRNGKPLASVASRTRGGRSLRRPYLLAKVTARLFYTRVVAFALRSLANWDGCGICVITCSERSKNRGRRRATFGHSCVLPDSRPFVTNWYEHAMRPRTHIPPLGFDNVSYRQISFICFAWMIFFFIIAKVIVAFMDRPFQLLYAQQINDFFLPSDVEQLLFKASCKRELLKNDLWVLIKIPIEMLRLISTDCDLVFHFLRMKIVSKYEINIILLNVQGADLYIFNYWSL
jgi:hypothetical protein